ncbi:MAG TPA: FHA domain-containing protein [Gemmataceae bacterium]|nr:FHA domain-containing protein [Gemmataceae bacterium]
MSLVRLIIWSCLIGGWAAFLSWLITEIPFHHWIDQEGALAFALAVIMATFVAVAIGGGVSVASGLTNPKIPNLLKRLGIGLAGGLIGGLIASLLSGCIFSFLQGVPVLGFLSRVLGWTLIGIGVGVAEGIFDRNINKIRNGLIGGAVGGFVAGLFFVPVSYIFGSPMSSRAFAFVLLGLCIGLFIGLAQVILKEAWLTVEQGFRAGRQMILGQDEITMGTSEKSSLIFIAYGAKGVEPIHLKISKMKDGTGYMLEDNQSRTGTLLNGRPVTGPTPLQDGDAIQFGVNVVRFNERVSQGAGERLPPPVVKQAPMPAPIPAGAIQTKPPAAPIPTGAIQPPAKPVPKPAAPKPAAPKPAAAPKAASPPQPQEGRCPICDRKIVGIPGERRCGKCFTTF